MKFRWRGRTYIFGKRDKEENQKAARRTAEDIGRLVSDAKPVPDPISNDEEFASILTVFSGSNPIFEAGLSARDRIISVTSLLGEVLRHLILIKMTSSRGNLPSKTAITAIFEGTGTLASFADRINYCSAFGIITPEVKGDLGILKDIRNKAAHRFEPVSFKDEFFSKRSVDLKLTVKLERLKDETEAEFKFRSSSMMILIVLLFGAIYLSQELVASKAISSDVMKKALETWNPVMAKVGWPEIKLPGS